MNPQFIPMLDVYASLAAEADGAQGRAPSSVRIACARDGGDCDCFDMAFASPMSETASRFCERVMKFMLWGCGASEIFIHAPEALGQRIARDYSPNGKRAFDCGAMADAYGKPLKITLVASASDLPQAKSSPRFLGGHLEGCRLGFDLGASDYKVAAVRDGETVFAEEIPWVPVTAADPDYHFEMLQAGLKKAASFLPRVDAIGGSSAGVIVDNEIKTASLIRGVQGAARARAQRLFKRVREAWRVPVEVANDGDVAALAGAMSLGKNAILGIAMGSSEAAGYIDREGRLTGRLSELAFAPVDFGVDAPVDEWSGDNGVGASYFSQQAVNRLAVENGFAFPNAMPLPERLKKAQAAMADDDPVAIKIFGAIGDCLGRTLPWYRMFYDFDTVLLLGRVMSGKGGELIVSTARKILSGAGSNIALSMPDEKARRVGQCVAAASLPRIGDLR